MYVCTCIGDTVLASSDIVLGDIGDIVLASSEAAKAESMIMTPRLWFWHKFHMRAMPEDENKSLCQNDFVRRVRGRELADALCHSNTSTCVCGTGQGEAVSCRLCICHQ